MCFDGVRQPNTQYVLSISYGKDSLACLGAIEELGWPLDKIIHIEVWATEAIQADLPPMVEFKAKADATIKARWGINVEHIRGPHTVEQEIYRQRMRGNRVGETVGWPRVKGCEIQSSCKRGPYARAISGAITYLGIASDEPDRIARHSAREGIYLPLVKTGWTEKFCRQWCIDNDILSPIYTTATRGGCWFCPQQSTDQLRILRHNYPDLWALMLKWDNDSLKPFHPDGHTVHDYDRRFALEDEGIIDPNEKFRWSMLENQQLRLF